MAASSSSSSSSSSLPSENEKEDHPFQKYDNPGPTGAYEARQVKSSGFYVRVDMPGVPPDGVKLVKYGETQTVTFSGKAPKVWIEYDSSERVYGGYVVLDRDPTQIDIEMKAENGSMRLFFRGSEGTLHFLSGFKRAPNVEDRVEADSLVYNETTDGSESCFSMADSANSVSPDIAYSHINPFLIQGVEGVYETRQVQAERMYIRVDMPGIRENQYKVVVVNMKKKEDAVLYRGEGKKEHRFDQGGRTYLGTYTLHCGCCKILNMYFYLTHGVLRILVGKRKIPEGLANTRTKPGRRR